jgi:thiamine-monophosphate kinase
MIGGGSPGGARRLEERAFHAWLVRHLPAARRGRLPLGDDAADLVPPKGRIALATTDALVEGIHFLRRSRPERIGAAAANVSLSDLASKGAETAGLLLAVLAPPGTPASWARSVVLGAERATARAGAHVVGGDTKPSPVRTVVGTAIGWADPRHLPPRRGARAGDVLVTTGTVGGGGGWADALERRGPTAEVLAGLLRVTPRLAAGRALARVAHAMLDTSDGIAEGCRLLSAASQVRVVLEEPLLPLDPRVRRLPEERRRGAAFFGGDYELLATVPARRWPAAERAVRATGTPIARVGRVERGRGAVLLTASGRRPMPLPGWQPFRPRPVVPR